MSRDVAAVHEPRGRRFDRDELASLVEPRHEAEALARLRGLIEAGAHAEARQWFAALAGAGWRPEPAAVETLARAWMEAGQATHVAAVLDHARAAGVGTTRPVRALTVETWARLDRPVRAQEALEEMVWRGDDPGAYLHQIVMAAWARRGAADRVLALRDQLVAAGREIGRHHRASVVEALAKAGRVDEARGELRRALNEGHPLGEREYETVARACAGDADGPAVEGVLADMADAHMEPTPGIREAAVVAWARAGNYERARAAFEQVADPDRGSGVWWGLMLACVKDGQLDEADAALSRMIEGGLVPEARHYRLLIQARRRAGEPDAVRRLLRDAVAREVALDVYTYEVAADALAAAGRPEGVREIAAAMWAWGPPPTAKLYTLLVRAELAAGRVDRAEAALAEMRGQALTPTPTDVEAVARALEEWGRQRRADALRRIYQRPGGGEDGTD